MLEWFTTIPGILIICGVILLIIAIILFVVGAKKSKKEGIVASNSTIVDNVTVENVNPVSDVITPVTPQDINVNDEEFSSINIETPNIVEENIHINEPEVISIPNEEFTSGNSEVNTLGVAEPVSEEVEFSDLEKTATIYGGEIPKFDFSMNEEKPVTIYGGNDPLEATQALPKMEESHIPYGGNANEVKIVEPMISQEVPAPVEETIIPMPTPIEISEQEVVNIPVGESVINEHQETSTVETTGEKVEVVEEL